MKRALLAVVLAIAASTAFLPGTADARNGWGGGYRGGGGYGGYRGGGGYGGYRGGYSGYSSYRSGYSNAYYRSYRPSYGYGSGYYNTFRPTYGGYSQPYY